MINMEHTRQQQKQDAINHPAHYTQGGVECWEAMKACMSADEFKGYLRGCAIKYLWRCNDKGTCAQDIQKARAYVEKLLEQVEGQRETATKSLMICAHTQYIVLKT